VNRVNNVYILSEEEAIKEQIEELKSRVTQLHNDIKCLRQCSRLSNLLGKMYEIREGLNQLGYLGHAPLYIDKLQYIKKENSALSF